MYRFWNSIVHPVFDVLKPTVIVEIGSFEGKQTLHLLEYCAENDAVLHAVDPEPKFDVESLHEDYGDHFVFHQDLSLNILAKIPEADAILIDGDHNWYTVFNELCLIEKTTENKWTFPTVFFHDTEWPYGRRDMYYNPQRIPESYRHPHEQTGLMPGNGVLDKGGMNAEYHHAIYENPLRNGVRTAIEDFMEQSKLKLQFVSVPGLHGLGILVPQKLLKAKRTLASLVKNIESNVLTLHIQTMEQERLHTLCRVQKQMQARTSLFKAYGRLKKELQNEQQRTERFSQLIEEREAQLQQRNEQLKERTTLLKKYDAALKERTARLKEYDSKLMERTEHLKERNALLSERASQLQEQKMQLESLDAQLEEMQSQLREKNAELERIRHTLSWQLMAPLRSVRNFCRKVVRARVFYGVFGFCRRVWAAFGYPFPRATRAVRYGFFGKVWPVRDAYSGMKVSNKQQSMPKNNAKALRERWGRVDIVIPTYNNAEYTVRCIRSVVKYTSNFRIVWVDNGSTQEQIAMVESTLQNVPHTALKFPDRLGFVKATNAGLGVVSSDVVVLLNNDTEVTAGWLEGLLRPLDEDTKVGIVGPVTDAKTAWQGNVLRGAGYCPAPNMLAFFCAAIRKEVTQDIGHLSEDFGEGYGEDSDYCARALEAGWKVILSKESFVRHEHRVTFHAVFGEEEAHRLRKRGLALFRSKHPAPQLEKTQERVAAGT